MPLTENTSPTATNYRHNRVPSSMIPDISCEGKVYQDLSLGQFYCGKCNKLVFETPIASSRAEHPKVLALVEARTKAGRKF